MRKILIIYLLMMAGSAFCQKKMNVLFVGNSLTYFNNLPEIVKRVAACDSVEFNYKMIALPNYAIIDHWNEGEIIREVNSKQYNFVVVQQGPSSQQEGREYLLNYGLKLDSLCDKNKAKLASYMVWPAKARSFDFPGVYTSYKLLADSTKGIFCPAGAAWLKLWETNPDFKLYGSDQFHPSYNGSLLAALVIYGSLTKKNSLGFSSYEQLKQNDLSRADFNALLKSAQVVLKENNSKKKAGKN
jgi:hypothetical protein